jgi:lipopolysaccharide/colanic/teichoic acid biosynthesis glycosyltransferase
MNKPQVQYQNKDKNIYISGSKIFWRSKRVFDLIICFCLMPILIIITLSLMVLNLFLNKGPVFYIQTRMGKNFKAFKAIKFRTMIGSEAIIRKYTDPLERDRITALGVVLRKTRLDELPQILNVIIGDMSLIGPRPDFYDHAIMFKKNIPDYKFRYSIRPGISGLSQIRLGYAEGLNETKKKSKIDLYYIENVNFSLEVKIFFGTIVTIIMACGN